MKITIVLPTLNEEDGIGDTIDSIKADEFSKRNWDFEILVVDGKSKDRTQEIAKEKGAHVLEEPRKGYGRAYKTGFKAAKGDIIITGDADGTYPFNQVHDYVDILLKENIDFITTDRFANLGEKSMSLKHHLGNFILSSALRLLFGVSIRDSQSGMWIMKKKALNHLKSLETFDDGMPFSEEIKIEMFKNKHLRAKEIPSCLYKRKGVAKIQSWGDGWKNLKFLILLKVGG